MTDRFRVNLLEPRDTIGLSGGQERGEQTQQSRTRLMEICNQAIHAGEQSRRINENVCFGEMGMVEGRFVFAAEIFDCSYRGRAHGNATSPVRADCFLSRDGNFVDFPVDLVICNQFGGHGAESAQPNVQGDFVYFDAELGDASQNLRRKMETSGGGGDRNLTGFIRVDRLVAFEIDLLSVVTFLSVDVRRQGHLPTSIGDLDHGVLWSLRSELDEGDAIYLFGSNGGGEFVGERERGSDRKSFTRT